MNIEYFNSFRSTFTYIHTYIHRLYSFHTLVVYKMNNNEQFQWKGERKTDTNTLPSINNFHQFNCVLGKLGMYEMKWRKKNCWHTNVRQIRYFLVYFDLISLGIKDMNIKYQCIKILYLTRLYIRPFIFCICKWLFDAIFFIIKN